MKLQFKIRTLLWLTVAACVALSCLAWVQDQRQRGAEVLQQTLDSLRCERGFTTPPIGAVIMTPFDEAVADPSWWERLLGNTVVISSEIQFHFQKIVPETAHLLSQSNATQSIEFVRFFEIELAADTEYFLKNWNSVEYASFHNVKLTSQWKTGILEQSEHIRHMSFAGHGISFSLADFCKLTHLETLMLSRQKLSSSEIEQLRQALPDTRVILFSLYQKKEMDANWQVDTDPEAIKLFHERFQQIRDELEDELGVRLGEPDWPVAVDIKPMSSDQVARYEYDVGVPLPETFKALLQSQSLLFTDSPAMLWRGGEQHLVCTKNGVDYSTTNCHLKDVAQQTTATFINILRVGELANGNPIWINLNDGTLLASKDYLLNSRGDLLEHLDYCLELIRSLKSNGEVPMPSY